MKQQMAKKKSTNSETWRIVKVEGWLNNIAEEEKQKEPYNLFFKNSFIAQATKKELIDLAKLINYET